MKGKYYPLQGMDEETRYYVVTCRRIGVLGYGRYDRRAADSQFQPARSEWDVQKSESVQGEDLGDLSPGLRLRRLSSGGAVRARRDRRSRAGQEFRDDRSRSVEWVGISAKRIQVRDTGQVPAAPEGNQ